MLHAFFRPLQDFSARATPRSVGSPSACDRRPAVVSDRFGQRQRLGILNIKGTAAFGCRIERTAERGKQVATLALVAGVEDLLHFQGLP
jgi:hypothetical protein